MTGFYRKLEELIPPGFFFGLKDQEKGSGGASGVYMGTRKKQILIIDDDANIRMLLEFLLRKTYRVTTREDGLSGMAWLSAGNFPDLILADIDMPRLNGYHLLKNIRESGLFSDIPVIMLSGFESIEVKNKCFDQGANGYLIKPFNPETIFNSIEKALLLADNQRQI